MDGGRHFLSLLGHGGPEATALLLLRSRRSAAMLSSIGWRTGRLQVVSATASRRFCGRAWSEARVFDEVPSLRCCVCASASRREVNRVRGEWGNAKHFSGLCEGLASTGCSAVSREAATVFAARSPAGASSIQRFSTSSGGQAVVEPSLTPLQEHFDDELAAREAVLKYLKSQDIESEELETVALPPSVTVMAERVAFLKKIGLTTKDIRDYPLMVGCSVKKNLVPVLSYLEKWNVEARFLPDLIRKYPMVLNSSVAMDLEPVVSFLLGIGIDRLHIGRVLTRYPDILGFKIEGTMSTSVAYLVSLGVNMREIGAMITECPEILGMRVGNNIKPKVDYLLDLGIPKAVLAKVLEVKPFILAFDLENKMKVAVQDLRDAGVRDNHIAQVLIQYADVLGFNVKVRLDAKVGWLVKHVGAKREDIGQILEKLPQILALNIALAQSRVTFFTKGGFSLEDLGIMVTKCPQILALSVEEVLKPNLSFFVDTMKRPLSEVVAFPFYFTYSLEKRIQPRYTQSKEKGIQCSLSWLLNCSEKTFSERLRLDFVERPEDSEVEPLASMGGRVRVKGEDILEEAEPVVNPEERVKIRREEVGTVDTLRIKGDANDVASDYETKVAAES